MKHIVEGKLSYNGNDINQLLRRSNLCILNDYSSASKFECIVWINELLMVIYSHS